MLLNKRILIFITFFIIFSGAVIANYEYNNVNSIDPSSSTVYVENGVSGTVIITDPFLNKTSAVKIDYYPLSTGSGVIISSDGYIITALHVIGDPKISGEKNRAKKMDEIDIKNYLEKAALEDYISHINPRLGEQLTDMSTGNQGGSYLGNTDVIRELLHQRNLINTRSQKHVIKVRLPSSEGISSFYSYDARLIDTGDSAKNEDAALIKIDPVKKLHALKITSKSPVIGDTIRIYGYPGTKNMQNDVKNSLVPSSSSGFLTATKPNNKGIVYYQTTAPTAKGYSGGPAVNNRNEIVGIIIYGVERHSYFGKQYKSQSSLFISSKYLINICRENKVSNSV